MDPILASLLVLLFCFIFLSVYRYASSENIWKEAGIPYTPEIRTIINMKNMFLQPFHEMINEGYKKQRKNGYLHGTYLFGSPQLTVTDPELIKQVLVKDFQNFMDRVNFETGDKRLDKILSFARGDAWKRIRTVLSPGFSTGKMRRMTDIILECAETLKKNVEEVAAPREPIELKKFFNTFTMDAIASSAFGTKIDSHNDPNNPFVVAGREVFNRKNQIKIILFMLFNKVTKFLRLKPSDIFGSKFFGNVAIKLAAERKASGERRGDFLQLLLDALESNQEQPKQNGVQKEGEHDDHEHEEHEEKNDSVKTDTTTDHRPDTFRKVLKNEDELISQCILLFVGGFETIATSIAFVVYELAINQDVQETLIQEIEEMIKNEKEDKLTYENVQGLKYLDAVVNEAVRKYPAGVLLQRMSTVDCTIGEGDNKIKIPKGTTIMIPTYGMHHDPEYFPDPEKFDPERFSPETKGSINPYVYTPFGVGPRNCIAMRFALFEIKLCVAHLLRSFRFHTCQKTQIPFKCPAGQTSFIFHELFLLVERRNSSV